MGRTRCHLLTAACNMSHMRGIELQVHIVLRDCESRTKRLLLFQPLNLVSL